MAVINHNWKEIRSLNGSQDKAFEELCAQLARELVTNGARFVRNGTPDGGVECVIIQAEGDEWGWQSKYVFSADESQWSQMDESVATALRSHPRLVRYYICLPIDLPDARLAKKTSARDKWNTHKAKWEKWASQRQMEVDFLLWDSSHLLSLLSKPGQRGKVMFWFGTPGCFDDEWFQTQITKALKSAGPRYTPELHIDLPVNKVFDAFSRNQEMVSRVQESAQELQNYFKSVSWWSDGPETPGLGTAAQPLKKSVGQLFDLLDSFAEQPIGSQGFAELLNTTEGALTSVEIVEKCINNIQEGLNNPAEDTDESKRYQHQRERLNNSWHTLRELENTLRHLKKLYSQGFDFAEKQLLVLRGEAGTGKTHLFCDLATQRLAQKRPTVLLLGQSFTTTEEPSRQLASLLGMPSNTLDNIVCCLEATAQAANSRALILIDALNEGMGRNFWPPHIVAFIETILRSPWIALAVSVRTCYLETLIPTEVLATAAQISHYGFGEMQHIAAKAFFLHHGLEFATTPVFSAEFSNPLFLKTLCRGLKASGYRTLPRGFHGITKVFELYVDSTDILLAERLDYPPKLRLVFNSLRCFTIKAAKLKNSSMSLDIARETIDGFLQGRNYSQSLYKALLDEGLLMESLSYSPDGNPCDIVSISYERWADHLTANELLSEHLDLANPRTAFKIGGPLALIGEGSRMSIGLVEALSIQLPERIGRELLSLAPYGLNDWQIADAFLKSVVWRAPDACTRAMRKLLNFLETQGDQENSGVWDTRISVATIPEHSLNMEFMDDRLRSITMPDRDEAWSIAIHRAWDCGQSIKHLVEWAWGIDSASPLDDESIWLSSLTLCWCFTTSNRFLRDRATKAAVNLLDGRLDWAIKIIRHFSGIDDLYVWERVLAVANGVALRCSDPIAVGRLAESVFDTVFALKRPPAHILLRDYARGVVERAVYLGSHLSFDPAKFKPPYASGFPEIPSIEEVKSLATDWKEIGKSLPDEEWARYSILHSIQDDDFARYVIGTNFGYGDWLSERLGVSEWRSAQEKIDAMVTRFSEQQRRLWFILEKLNSTRRHNHDLHSFLLMEKFVEGSSSEIFTAYQTRHSQRSALKSKLWEMLRNLLSADENAQISALIEERKKPCSNIPPRFDLRLIQRYVAKRVFDLGWSVERFGWFDRTYMRHYRDGRSAHKAERIGKKYQWIAYHEICAFIADHYKYKEDRCGNNPEMAYQGPWQGWFRDIDPTHGIRSLPLSNSDRPRSYWWIPVAYTNWQSERNGAEWALDDSDFPDVPSLLRVTDEKGVAWLNAFSILVWNRARLPSQNYDDAENRTVWLKFQAFLVKSSDVKKILEWGSQDIGCQWMWHDIPHETRPFLGEFGWAQASHYFEHPYHGNNGWNSPEGCPVKVLSVPVSFHEENSTFDCSLDESFSLHLPCPLLVRHLNLKWTGIGTDFEDNNGVLLATDPSAHSKGDGCLLLREDTFCSYLNQNDLAMVWGMCGQKECLGPSNVSRTLHQLRFIGAFALTPKGFEGRIRNEKTIHESEN